VAAAAAARAPRRLLRWPESAPSGEPIFAIAGERLKLSLSYVSCAGGLAILAALLVVTFALGWWGGKRSGLAARRAGDVPFNPAVAPGLGQRERQAPPPSAVRQKGKWYLVIQGLGGTKQADRDEAGRIIAFLAASGEQAGLATYKSSTGAMQYIVWSLRPFDSPGSNAAQDFARQTEALGKKYFDKHKTYDFRQRTAANKFNPWFELAR